MQYGKKRDWKRQQIMQQNYMNAVNAAMLPQQQQRMGQPQGQPPPLAQPMGFNTPSRFGMNENPQDAQRLQQILGQRSPQTLQAQAQAAPVDPEMQQIQTLMRSGNPQAHEMGLKMLHARQQRQIDNAQQDKLWKREDAVYGRNRGHAVEDREDQQAATLENNQLGIDARIDAATVAFGRQKELADYNAGLTADAKMKEL